jgi:hypothetical protein
MANVSAIYSVGDSLAAYLRHAYELTRADEGLPACTFRLVPSGEMIPSESGTDPVDKPGLTLYLYRVTVNEHLRNDSGQSGTPPLTVNLHYLLTVWADEVKAEQQILAWTMRTLHTHQALSPSDLTPDAGWATGELVQIIPAEISLEDLTRLWNSLHRPLRPSLTYMARAVQIGIKPSPQGKPVVARRLTFSDGGPVE